MVDEDDVKMVLTLFRKKTADEDGVKMVLTVLRKKAVNEDDVKMVLIVFRKKAVDVDDVKMAVQMQCEQNNTAPPSREVLLELSQFRWV